MKRFGIFNCRKHFTANDHYCIIIYFKKLVFKVCLTIKFPIPMNEREREREKQTLKVLKLVVDKSFMRIISAVSLLT